MLIKVYSTYPTAADSKSSLHSNPVKFRPLYSTDKASITWGYVFANQPEGTSYLTANIRSLSQLQYIIIGTLRGGRFVSLSVHEPEGEATL